MDKDTSTAGQIVTHDPASYTIEFLTNGTVNIKADCNDLTGRYEVGVPLDLTIEIARTTLALCGDASLDRDYLDDLARVAAYSTDSGALTLYFADDVAGMRFTTLGS